MLPIDGFIFFLMMLLALVFLQRLLHREIQAVFLILTRQPGIATLLFAIVFFPGVLLHELSHFVMARILFVRTGRVSVVPRFMGNGRLQLGFVETERTDFVRDSLVGLAPLISGGLLVAYAGVNHMHILLLWDVFRNGQWTLFWMGVQALPSVPDFWLWFYLTFAISSTMFPSESDRHAWAPLGIFVVILFGLAILSGGGEWMLANLTPLLNDFLRSVALLFALSIGIHAVLLLPVWLAHRILTRLTGLDAR